MRLALLLRDPAANSWRVTKASRLKKSQVAGERAFAATFPAGDFDDVSRSKPQLATIAVITKSKAANAGWRIMSLSFIFIVVARRRFYLSEV